MVSKSNKKSVKFSLKPGRAVNEVALAGNFNDWRPVSMKKQKDGSYCATVGLGSGTYEYKFIVDGQWITDPDNAAVARNVYGSFNSTAQL